MDNKYFQSCSFLGVYTESALTEWSEESDENKRTFNKFIKPYFFRTPIDDTLIGVLKTSNEPQLALLMDNLEFGKYLSKSKQNLVQN